MKIGWKTSAVKIEIDGSFSEPFTDDEGNPFTITWDDSGSAETNAPSEEMSSFVCNARGDTRFEEEIDFGYTTDDPNNPSGSFPVLTSLVMPFSSATALRDNNFYWLQDSYAGIDVVSTNATGAEAGDVFVDGAFVAKLYIIENDLFPPITLIRPYTIKFNTIAENIPD